MFDKSAPKDYHLMTTDGSSKHAYYKAKAVLENQNPAPSWPIDLKTRKPLSRNDKINAKIPEALTTIHKGFYHTQTMMENPLIGVKYSNLLSNPDGSPLICYLDGLNPAVVAEQGYFTECDGEETNPVTKKKEKVYAGSYPKVYSMSCNLNILHKNKLGQTGLGSFGDLFQV